MFLFLYACYVFLQSVRYNVEFQYLSAGLSLVYLILGRWKSSRRNKQAAKILQNIQNENLKLGQLHEKAFEKGQIVELHPFAEGYYARDLFDTLDVKISLALSLLELIPILMLLYMIYSADVLIINSFPNREA